MLSPRKFCAIVIAAVAVLALSASAQISELDKGHRILLNRGLQIQAMVTDYPAEFDLNQWATTHYTTVQWQWNTGHVSLLGPAPGLPWGRWVDFNYFAPTDSEAPYASNLVSLQCEDELDMSDPTARQNLANWFSAARPNFPNTLLFTNLEGYADAPANIALFMQQAQPDMLMYDSYPGSRFFPIVGGSMRYLYEDMAKFRTLGLAGNDGTGAHPIPVGHWLQNFSDFNFWPRYLSESEMRAQQFAGWTFGEKLESSFVYNSPPPGNNIYAQFFNRYGDTSPTPALAQQAESNRQSLNLGKALVRLISKDVRYFPGQHKDSNNNTVNDVVPNGMQAFQPGVSDPYLVTALAQNMGTTNNGLKGDVIIGWFKVLQEDMDGPDAHDEIYFMVMNGLTDANGSAADCRQKITLQWNFGTSGITELERLNRETGLVEDVPLTPAFPNRMQLQLVLDGGTADLFKFKDGAPFVGFVPEPAMGLAGIALLVAMGSRRRRVRSQRYTPSLVQTSGGERDV